MVVEFDEPGSFNLAGAAPGGPEVDEHGLALVAGEGDFFTVQIGEREVGRRLVQERRNVLRNIACAGHQFAFGYGSETRLGCLFAVFPIGPARPGEDSQEEKDSK